MKAKILIAALFMAAGSTVAQADSVHQWGHWMQDDAAKRILSGADPSQVTEPSAAGPGAGGTTIQPVINTTVSNPVITQEGMPKIGITVTPTPTPGGQDVGGGRGGFQTGGFGRSEQ